MHISRTKTLKDLKNKLCDVVKKTMFYPDDVTESNLRLWKLNAQVSLERLKKVFVDKISPASNTEALFKFNEITYLEYNDKAKLDEIDLADTDNCLVELSYADSPWIFEIKKLEQKDGKCEWCNYRKMLRYFCACKEVWYCTEHCMDKNKIYHQNQCKKRFEIEESDMKETVRSKKGLVGLQNLGNTCFMNTALQCMSNCYELTQYFLQDYFKNHINYDNPIGTGGILAKAYANFLKNVWYGDSSLFSPWNFKRAIATFQSMFSGYQQHDTQEFLNYLLDGLHEDLNKVLKKPLVEKDETQQIDEIKSRNQWIGFLRRNQSVLVDILYGQYKSTLHCPDQDCQNISTTFDPFLSISLPLAHKTETYEVKCFFIFYDIRISPVQLNLPFSTETTIMALRNKVAKILNVHPFSFFVIKMDAQGNYDHLVYSSALLKVNNYNVSENSKPFFLFQIDPELFYSHYNKYCLENKNIISMLRDFRNYEKEIEGRESETKKLFSDDYEEDESGATSESLCYYSKVTLNTMSGSQTGTMRINTDDNYGFSKDYLKVIIHLFKYDDNSYNNGRTRIIFPRILYINKQWTTKQIHLYIFRYFSKILRDKESLDEENWPDDRLFEKFFDGIDTDNENDTYEFQKKHGWPYRLRLRNFFSARYGECYFCERGNCKDCLLPYDNSITLADVIAKMPKNGDLEIDNNYLYLNEKQKFYANHSNRDIAIEATWLPEYYESVHKLNDKKDVNFKIQIANRNRSVSVYDCFKNFVKLEKLEDNNEWYCPECKKHQKATKKMEIYTSPHILIIHLKRFKNNSKIDTVVDFPIEGLDISQYVISNVGGLPLVYDLFAISNHYGSMGFGHYTAFAKNPLNNRWYEFDDSHVSEKRESELINSSAYVLFYRRRGLEKFINLEKIYNKSFIDFENDKNMDIDLNNTNITESSNELNDAASNRSAALKPVLNESIPTQANELQTGFNNVNLNNNTENAAHTISLDDDDEMQDYININPAVPKGNNSYEAL
jgi:ubiquitin C-terminal hydrolase